MINKGRYIEGFSTWLQVLNYTQTSVINYPLVIEKLLNYMTENEVTNIEEITGERVKLFFEYIGTIQTRTGQPYKVGTLRTYLTAVRIFARYMRETEYKQIEVPVKYKGKSEYTPTILTISEVTQLYDSLEDSLLGMRDRAMLAVYYGCGARRNEGANLMVKDILPDKNLLYIRKGKNYKERYIPIIGQVKKDIIQYLTIARPMLLNKKVHEYFFCGKSGNPLGSQMMLERIIKLMGNTTIDKKIGVHALRHSIATHLLQQGMKLTEIAKFLGHTTLESTQIYTHIEAEITKDKDL
jgi:integrase/recombinase XerD